jgi:hypothetical protein
MCLKVILKSDQQPAALYMNTHLGKIRITHMKGLITLYELHNVHKSHDWSKLQIQSNKW